MVTSRVSIYISRPVATVWKYMTDIENYKLWHNGTEQITASNQLHLGSSLKVIRLVDGQLTNMGVTITDNDGKSHLGAKSIQGPIDFVAHYRVTPQLGGCEVEMLSYIDAHAFMRLAEPTLRELSDTQNLENLELLKHLVESTPDN